MVRVEVEVHTQRGSAPSAAKIFISWVLAEINRLGPVGAASRGDAGSTDGVKGYATSAEILAAVTPEKMFARN
jgi:hypothetical protein